MTRRTLLSVTGMRGVITSKKNVGHVTVKESGDSDSMSAWAVGLDPVCSSPPAKSSCVYLCTMATGVDVEDVDPDLMCRSSPEGELNIAGKGLSWSGLTSTPAVVIQL